jgi:hypothetical protein
MLITPRRRADGLDREMTRVLARRREIRDGHSCGEEILFAFLCLIVIAKNDTLALHPSDRNSELHVDARYVTAPAKRAAYA